MRVGSTQHRDLFCRWFIETHVVWEPGDLPWPPLDVALVERLRAFPFWSHARSIERRAGKLVTAFAQTIEDPLIREAVALQGMEETRHGRLMGHVLQHYGIDVPEVAFVEPRGTTEDFRVFGFGECMDSFLGFGAFAIARRKRLFPAALLDIFDRFMWEEARHIAFFVNWWRYEQARAGRDGVLRRTLESVGYYVKTVSAPARGVADVPWPKLEGNELFESIAADITPAMFLAAALEANRSMMARIDRRLLRPVLMPRLATALLLTIRALPPREPAVTPPVSPFARAGT
ncbi:MAG: hypothetical protein JWO85_3157 [Candidatus Eremiobacteraeota bacterium]|nr:hypothetical protein [Candidatus Eremiobacteraeota bacterium]